jgi:hypothetical protein
MTSFRSIFSHPMARPPNTKRDTRSVRSPHSSTPDFAYMKRARCSFTFCAALTRRDDTL